MRRYVIVLAVMALLVGSLFKAYDQTGVKLMRMFGTLGIALFGIIGTMALTRWQSREGLKEIQSGLKSLEPECLITDWLGQGGGRPDYLVVAPGGIVAVCVEDTPQSAREKRAAANIAKGRERVEAAVRWLRDRLNEAAPELKEPLGAIVREMPVGAVLVLSRRKAVGDYSTGGVTVLNPDQLASHIRSLWDTERLDEATRIRLTRVFRSA